MAHPAVKMGRYLLKNITVPAGEKPPYVDQEHIWIEKDDGEGMSISHGLMGEWLDTFFREHF